MGDEGPVPSTLLVAGQKGLVLQCDGVLARCRAAVVPGKGRGLLAAEDTPKNGLLHLEPALASGATHVELAAALRYQAEGGTPNEQEDALMTAGMAVNRNDGALTRQLLGLCAWGEAPTSVEDVPPGEELTYMVRQPKRRDAALAAANRRILLGEDAETEGEAGKGEAGEEAFRARLLERLERAARSNAFRGAVDPLGALAWHSLAPREQAALREKFPEKVPSPRLWLFLRASLFNHGDAPNATWLIVAGVIVVRAAREIKAGEEVLLSYWPDVDAAEAMSLGLLDGFGVDAGSASEELALSPGGAALLARLKASPFEAAAKLEAVVASGGDVADAFEAAASTLNEELRAAEAGLPKHLVAFLEPRFVQAQLSLQTSAILAARGEEKKGEVLRGLALARMKAALGSFTQPWGKRVLLRLIFALKGTLRPAPAGLLKGAVSEAGDVAEGDFVVNLAQQARATPEELQEWLEGAVEAVFGDRALLPAVLGKCGVAAPTAVVERREIRAPPSGGLAPVSE